MTSWDDRPRTRLGAHSAIVAGDGPTLLLLHGVGLRAEAWAPIIDHFAASRRVVAPDMAGHGNSAALTEPATLAAFAKPLADLLTGPTIIVGHSMGAMLALHLAQHDPAKVQAVAALNAIYQRSDTARAAVRQRAAGLDGRTTTDPGPTLNRWFGTADNGARQACDHWLRGVDPAAYKAAYTVFAHEDGPPPDALRRLPCPALFMTGADEPNSTPAMSRAMAALAPQGEALIVPGAAHMMPMTHPGQVIAALQTLITRAAAERT